MLSETNQALSIVLSIEIHLNLEFKRQTLGGVTLRIKCDRVKDQEQATLTCT